MQIRWKLMLLVCLIAVSLIAGCASRKPLEPDHQSAEEVVAPSGPRLIAVMPVDNRGGEELASRILRDELRQHLYFKGYPVVPVAFIDERLSGLVDGAPPEKALSLPPEIVGPALGVDALLYPTILEWSDSRAFLYASTEVAAAFVLRSARTGEVLWQASGRERDRHMAISGGRAQAKAYISYDAALQKVLQGVMETFPDGPEAVGPIEPDTRTWFQRLLRR